MPAIPRIINRNKEQVRQFIDGGPAMFALPNVLGGIAEVGEPVSIPTVEAETAASGTSGTPDIATYGQKPVSTASVSGLIINPGTSNDPSVTEVSGPITEYTEP